MSERLSIYPFDAYLKLGWTVKPLLKSNGFWHIRFLDQALAYVSIYVKRRELLIDRIEASIIVIANALFDGIFKKDNLNNSKTEFLRTY
jgi:hypothetical protein